jgi:hypothetical protein
LAERVKLWVLTVKDGVPVAVANAEIVNPVPGTTATIVAPTGMPVPEIPCPRSPATAEVSPTVALPEVVVVPELSTRVDTVFTDNTVAPAGIPVPETALPTSPEDTLPSKTTALAEVVDVSESVRPGDIDAIGTSSNNARTQGLRASRKRADIVLISEVVTVLIEDNDPAAVTSLRERVGLYVTPAVSIHPRQYQGGVSISATASTGGVTPRGVT